MQGKPVIPAPGVDASDIPDELADDYATTDDGSSYSTGEPLDRQPLAQTGSFAWLYIIGASALGYFLFVKRRGRRGRRGGRK